MYYYRKSRKLDIKNRLVKTVFSLTADADDLIHEGVTVVKGEAETLLEALRVFDEEEISLIARLSQADLNAVLASLASRLTELILWASPTELSALEGCKRLRAVTVYCGEELTALWNARENPALEELTAYHCKRLKDLEGLRGSTVRRLTVSGEALSYADDSDAPTIKDLSPLKTMPNLNYLDLFIAKRAEKREDLLTLSALSGLQYLRLTKNYFTFKQFAWLKAKLPQVENLKCLYCYKYDKHREKDCFVIVGEGMPAWIEDDTGKAADPYIEAFNAYAAEFALAPFPPED